MCGIWHAVWSTSIPSRRSQYASTPRPSNRRHALARGAKRAGDGYRGLAFDFGQVAIDHRLEKHVVAPLRMQQRRIRSTRVEHVGDGGELFEIERHAARQILRRGPRFSHAGGDQLAGVADAAGGEHRLLGDLEARQGRSARRWASLQRDRRRRRLAPPRHPRAWSRRAPVRARAGCARTPRPSRRTSRCRRRTRRARAAADNPPCVAGLPRRLSRCPSYVPQTAVPESRYRTLPMESSEVATHRDQG